MGNVMVDRVETVRDETERGKVRAGGEMAVDARHFSQFGL